MRRSLGRYSSFEDSGHGFFYYYYYHHHYTNFSITTSSNTQRAKKEAPTGKFSIWTLNCPRLIRDCHLKGNAVLSRLLLGEKKFTWRLLSFERERCRDTCMKSFTILWPSSVHNFQEYRFRQCWMCHAICNTSKPFQTEFLSPYNQSNSHMVP
jgi:hypothetical protein